MKTSLKLSALATILVLSSCWEGTDTTPDAPDLIVTAAVSVDEFGAVGTGGDSFAPVASSDGSVIVFASDATNLVTTDTNGVTDIFYRDTATGLTTRISVDSAGTEATGGASFSPSVSADGRWVAFASDATNLVPGDTNAQTDIFLRDILGGLTTRLSVDTASIEATGGDSTAPSISGSGEWIAFLSAATNLVTGDTNGNIDVFVRDTLAATTTRISVTSAGVESTGGDSASPALSANGQFVAFASEATDLVAGDTNALSDIFLHDILLATTVRVSIGPASAEADGANVDPSISSDGSFIAFTSSATNLIATDGNGLDDIYLRDKANGITSRVSIAGNGGDTNGHSSAPALTPSGRYLAYLSEAANVVAGDANGLADVFVVDLELNTVVRASIDSLGTEATGGACSAPALSSDGRVAVFLSAATNLVADDTNALVDVFVHGPIH